MAPWRCYDLGRLEEAAEEAAKRAQAALGINAALTCRCDGVVGGGKCKMTPWFNSHGALLVAMSTENT